VPKHAKNAAQEALTAHAARSADGENTQGVFSRRVRTDSAQWMPLRLAQRDLPDGAGHSLLWPGLSADIIVPVFADDDIAAGKDPAMAHALEILGRKEE
jgi:hypothetical protein